MQPSLDKSWWKLWGGLDGHSGALVDKVLTEAADHLPAVDGLSADSSWRRATALVESLVSDDPPPAQVTVIVDAKEAAASDGPSRGLPRAWRPSGPGGVAGVMRSQKSPLATVRVDSWTTDANSGSCLLP
ncbi:MAG TPA: hypothetical protein VMQ46_01410 [Acidimicrobiia bacterium]|nr:hypothetical protein [Acidimicrobiia bacterium]